MMSDTRSELKKLVPLYCDELNSLDLSLYENYEFSKDYLNKKEKLIKNQSRIYYPLIKTTGRRIASAIIAAAIMGTTTVAAYAPARNAVRNFFLRIFNDHTVVSVQHDSKDIGNHKSKIEKQYSITVPEGFVLDESEILVCDIIQKTNLKVYISTNIQRILILHIMIMNVVISKLHRINSEMSLFYTQMMIS